MGDNGQVLVNLATGMEDPERVTGALLVATAAAAQSTVRVRGTIVALDGDVLAIMETLYREITARRGLDRTFEDMVQEIAHLIDQMDDAERRTYLAESLFLNTVKYENDKLEAYMRKIEKK